MKKIFYLFIITLAILSCISCFAFENGDLQYWLTTSMDAKINNSWKMKADNELRFGDSAGTLYYEHVDLGLTYSGLAKWLDVGGNYRLVYEKKGKSWFYENRPHINVTLKGSVYDFKLSNRNRLEYRDKETGKDGWRYRNKTAIKYPIKTEHFNITPYIADEVFADFIVCEISENRLYGGVEFKAMDHLYLDIYYMWKANRKNNVWTNANVIGTQIKLSF
ncbi:MAG: DUF2490 domain-containing protein [Candidatus Omnitrophica bacterium]|nr:DUF2490 domain-containing protein [Candidatus Omnitrophota bacterium]